MPRFAIPFLAGTLALLASNAFATTTVTFWHGLPEAEEVKNLEAIVSAFEAKNPDIRINLVQAEKMLNPTEIEKLMAAVSTGTGPDVYRLDRFTIAERAATHLLEGLSSHIAEEKVDLAREFIPGAWNEVQYKGEVYGLPLNTDARALYYRKDVLKEAGVDPALFDPAKGPMKLEEFKKIATRLNRKSKSGEWERLGFAPVFGQIQAYTWGFAFGAPFFDASRCKVTLAEPALMAAEGFVQTWERELEHGRVSKFLDKYAGINDPLEKFPFFTGRLPFLVNGSWFSGLLPKFLKEEQWGQTYLPTADGRKVSWSGGWSLVIPRGARQPKEAYRFIRFMSGPEGQRIAMQLGNLPTSPRLLEDASLFSPQLAFFRDLLPSSKSRPALPVGAKLWDELQAAQAEIVEKGAPVGQTLARAEAEVQKKMQKYCK